MYLSDVKIIHHSGQSQKKNYNISISNQLISKLKYYKKHSNIAAVLLSNISCFIFITTRIIAFAALSAFKTIYRLKAQAYLYSMKRYFSYLLINSKAIA